MATTDKPDQGDEIVSSPKTYPYEPLKILIAEDNSVNRKMLTRIMH